MNKLAKTPVDGADTSAAISTPDLSQAFVLLDNSSGAGAPSLLYTDPVEIVVAREPHEFSDAIARIERGLSRGLEAAGFFSYELGYALEPRLAHLLPKSRDVPLVWFGLYRRPRALGNAEVKQWLDQTTRSVSHEFSDIRLDWSREDYVRRFDRAIELIRAGDIYQLNLTFKARFRLTGSPLTFYRDLRAKQAVSYGAIVDTGEVTVLSASPELFILKSGRTIETRPMKGTASRIATTAGDEAQRRTLATDTKQRAENLMIVDLMRNDLSRVAEVGSVEVTDLFTVETFKTLHQMTSGVRAVLNEDVSLTGLLEAIYPAGSITGAPKIRAMELIAELESGPRGVYCGSIGRLSPDGTAQLNVAIRTPVIRRDGTGEMGIGSGVVYDSDGAREYDECLLKMKFLTDPPRPFELFETLLYEPGSGFWLIDEHLARLAASAGYFGFPFERSAVVAALDAAVADKPGERSRVRLTLAEDGRIAVTTSALPAPRAPTIMRYIVSPTRLSSADQFLYHKTTRRDLYDGEWAHYNALRGADEVLYLNENGDLAEGSRTNIFVERNGVLVTPPLAAGLLPGTLRASLIAEGRAVEGRLTLDDLARGEPVYLGNSVRGLVPAQPLDD
ncbi:MAG: aminodeoxychorismate synthase component I [Hyphomicrobiaceae bacterium]|nr:aminodeoxychorismate synthase component I [Hyphomicrobiaceae bacterium]